MCVINLNWPIICVYFLSFSSYASLSVIAPFFPSEAGKKGMSASLAGGVFSIFGVVLIVVNAIAGKILPVIGSKVSLTTGIVVVGLSNITFGLLHNIDNSQVFTVLCFIVRSIEGVGAALLNTTAYMILIKKCESNLSKAIAINEACVSIGYAVGPPLGSLFYTIGGYKLPFLVLGTTVLINIPFSILLFENYRGFIEHLLKELKFLHLEFSVSEQTDNEQRLSYLRLLSMPKVIMICLIIFVVGNNYGALESTAELYLESYGIGPKSVGLMFMLASGSYTAFSLIIGHVFAQLNGFKYLAFGLLLNIFAFMIIGPSPFFVLRGNLVFTGFALFLIGPGNAFALIPSMPTILQLTADDGYSNNVTNSSCVSGLWTMFYSIGSTIGPYFGAALFQYFGAEILFAVIAMINLLCFIISLKPLLSGFSTAEMRRDGYTEIDGCMSQVTI